MSNALSERLGQWRSTRIAALGITPLRYARRELVPTPAVGWPVRDGDEWIVTQTRRINDTIIRCSVLVGGTPDHPIWAVYDEGPG